jgi:pantoate--beta-alanine ligase
VVNKLLNIVQADIAVFGQKDFQQLAVIRKMVKDLCMPVKIIAAPTARANDGLALSSRNQYLNEHDRKLAPKLYAMISALQPQVESNLAKNAFAMQSLENIVTDQLTESGFKVDYLNIVDANTLAAIDQHSDQIVILVAAFLGSTRLIDNLNFFR